MRYDNGFVDGVFTAIITVITIVGILIIIGILIGDSLK